MTPFEIAKNINTKSGLLDTNEIPYSQYILNRAMSNTRDTIFLANEANKLKDMPDSAHYMFLYYAVPKNPRRFGKWHKQAAKTEDIEIIMRVYGYSRAKAEEAYPLFRNNLEELRKLGYYGGKH